MASTTAAQDEFNQLLANNRARTTSHPEDSHDDDDYARSEDDLSEEDRYRNAQIDEAMRAPTIASDIKLPPASFDSDHFTGVKGVIADARSYETARKTKWSDRARNARRSILGFAGIAQQPPTGNSVRITGGAKSESDTDDEAKSSNGDDDFLNEWRESRRRELESAANRAVRTRKTSPSFRVYGRLDVVDAMGYLDAIEKVSRETTVVVFVYDNEVSSPRTSKSKVMFYSRHKLTNTPCSARYQRRLKTLSCPWYTQIPRHISSRSTTTTLSLTRLPCPRFWRTATKAISSPTSLALSK